MRARADIETRRLVASTITSPPSGWYEAERDIWRLDLTPYLSLIVRRDRRGGGFVPNVFGRDEPEAAPTLEAAQAVAVARARALLTADLPHAWAALGGPPAQVYDEPTLKILRERDLLGHPPHEQIDALAAEEEIDAQASLERLRVDLGE